jgi:hypothetical protein
MDMSSVPKMLLLIILYMPVLADEQITTGAIYSDTGYLAGAQANVTAVNPERNYPSDAISHQPETSQRAVVERSSQQYVINPPIYTQTPTDPHVFIQNPTLAKPEQEYHPNKMTKKVYSDIGTVYEYESKQ